MDNTKNVGVNVLKSPHAKKNIADDNIPRQPIIIARIA